MLPFVFTVHYRLRGQPPNPYMNLPCKVVLARTGKDAIHKFSKKYPKYEAVFFMKR